jgi:branched-chain amino acid aminotransferase
MPDTGSFEFVRLPHASPTSREARAAQLKNPGFGRVFTDHMVTIRYREGRGWHDAEVKARSPIQVDPACATLHYAQEIFEGLKAYRAPDGTVNLFRPWENARRFQRSAARLAMPELPERLFLQALDELVAIDRDWVPEGQGSLYLRPFMIATEDFLGVKPAKDYIFAVIASPVGNYFASGSDAVSVWVSQNYTRAAPGGTGAAKCGGNYAASLIAQAEASGRGCDQVVFLDAVERKWIEELGGMNIFFLFDDGAMITPPLTGTILPGITRDSLIHLAREQGTPVREEPYSLVQWRGDAATGRLTEAFACGTAAVVTSIGKVVTENGEFRIGSGKAGPRAAALRESLVTIQKGLDADHRDWLHKVV